MKLNSRQFFFFAMLFGAASLVVALFFPYLQPLAIAAALAVVFRPMHRKLQSYVGASNGAAAFLTVVISVGLVLVPLIILGSLVFLEARGLVTYLRFGGYGGVEDDIVDILSQYMPGLRSNLASYVQDIGLSVAGNVRGVLSGTVSALFNFALSAIAFFYILKDGDRFAAAFAKVSPFKEERDYQILDRLEAAVNAVVTGTVVVAVVQGVLAGIGFAIFGIPSPALWGGVAIFAALIPGIGTSLVIVPTVLYLFYVGSPIMALALLAWGAVLVGLIDNILRPWLIGRSFNIHPFLVLLSVFGGLQLFGPLGIILGPISLALLIVLLDLSDHYLDGE